MARITRVKKAQQRYATKPVLDENGQQVRTPVMRNGVQIVTKRGPKFLRVVEKDLTKPLPNLRCDYPGCSIDGGEILPGTAYMWIKPKSGPYGGHQKNRHSAHPAWQVWDYSSSLSAQIARIEHDATEAVSAADSEDDVTSALESAAEAIRELAEQKREGAENIESGFGHATYQSEELAQQADDLESWADDVEGTDVEALGDFQCGSCTDGQAECDACAGTGKTDEDGNAEDCAECDGTGEQECQFCDGSGEDLEAARESWSGAVSDALGNCPV